MHLALKMLKTHYGIKDAQTKLKLFRTVVKSPNCHQTPLKTLQYVLTEAAYPQMCRRLLS